MFKKKALVFAFMCAPQFVFSNVDFYVWEQIGLDIDGEAASDYSGASVSLNSSGSTVAIGAYLNSAADRGHVRVYAYDGSAWEKKGQDLDGDADNDESGRSVALSSDGTILAVGAPKHDSSKGHVKVYAWDGSSTWIPRGTEIVGDDIGDKSGSSVSLSNDGGILAIGAPDHGGTSSGQVKVFSWSGSAWEPKGSDINGEYSTGNDNSGCAVALSGDGNILSVGARYNNLSIANGDSVDLSDMGHVRVYEFDGSSWNQKGSDIDGEAAGDFSGRSVALSNDGTIVAVGASNNDGDTGNSSDNRGHVKVYQWDEDGGSWGQRGQNIEGKATVDNSGGSVALSHDGTILAVGAVNNDGETGNSSDNRGHVKVYQWNVVTNYWDQLGFDIEGDAAGDQSGHSVSLSDDGTILAVGARFNDGEDESGNSLSNSGHVKIYRLRSLANEIGQLQDETISQIGFSFGQFSGASAVPFTSVASAKSFTVGDNLAHPISVQLEYKPRIMIRNSNDLKSLEGSASMNFTQNLAMGLDLGIIKKHSGAAVQSAAQIDNHIIKVGVNSFYLADSQAKRYYQVGASLNSGKMDLSRQGIEVGAERGHGIADVSILSAIGGFHTNLTNWSLPDYQVDLVGRLSRVTRDAYDEANDIVNALSYEKFDRDELDVNLSVSKRTRLDDKSTFTIGSAIQGTLVLHQSDATMTEQGNPSNTWTISPAIEHQARASVYTSLGYKASDSLWVNLNLSAQRDAFNKHNTAYFSVSVSF